MGLTPPQARLLRFIQAEARDGRVPSYREMMAAVGVRGARSIHAIVHALAQRGHVAIERGRSRSVRVLVQQGERRLVFIPVAQGGAA